jgi:hypothetical protein
MRELGVGNLRRPRARALGKLDDSPTVGEGTGRCGLRSIAREPAADISLMSH